MGNAGVDKLVVWQKAMDLAVRVYEITEGYPARERFGMAVETRSSARSIPYNIAEGKARTTSPDYRRFVGIARGSSGELLTQLVLARRLGYLSPSDFTELAERADEVSRMLWGLQDSLARF